MEDTPSELTRFYTLFILLTFLTHPISATAAAQELLKGFTATPDSSVASFQPLLSDSVGNYSFGFLRVDKTQLALAVIHVPSHEQHWAAGKGVLARWSSETRLSFNGSIVISDERTGVIWSSHTDGDRVRLSNTSNLLIERVGDGTLTLWQSFDFPYNTLMENLLKMCRQFLTKLMKHKLSWVFNKPVDAVALRLHDYHQIMHFEGLFRPIQAKLATHNHVNEFWVVDEFDGSPWDDIQTPDRSKKLKASEPIVVSPVSNKHNHSTAPNPIVPPVVSSPVRTPSPVKPSSTATRGAVPKPRAKDLNKRKMNMEEKQKLWLGLQSMPPEKIPQLSQIILKRNHQLQAQEGDEIELDIEAMDTETLWELHWFLTNWKKHVRKTKRQSLLVNNRH